jgi:hypothetical protein
MKNCGPWLLEEFQGAAKSQRPSVSDILGLRAVTLVPAAKAYSRAETACDACCCLLQLPADAGSRGL